MRAEWEAVEQKILAPQAQKSIASRGRGKTEEPCPLRTCYQRDRDRIIHSKSFRRLKQKTQVFIAPEGDHYRTRLTHTLEVSQISRTIARALQLNEDLTEAIALGHDLGHTPFGHSGERSLAAHYPGFSHNKQSLRVVEYLEKDGYGLNLTWEVRDGILNHSGGGIPTTLEGKIVHLSDRIAYVNHDIDDALRAGIIGLTDLPASAVRCLGQRVSQRINTMVLDVVSTSVSLDDIRMSDLAWQETEILRQFLFERVYWNEVAREQEVRVKQMIDFLWTYYQQHPTELPAGSGGDCAEVGQRVCDYIAGMTDHFALAHYETLGGPPLR